ncbi:MAG: hypothetical protein R2827_02175 [Bdellovibrionales bacterium]
MHSTLALRKGRLTCTTWSRVTPSCSVLDNLFMIDPKAEYLSVLANPQDHQPLKVENGVLKPKVAESNFFEIEGIPWIYSHPQA